MWASEVLMGTALFTAVFAVMALVGMMVDGRILDGHNVWLKPLKFGVSLTVYVGTLLWAYVRLSPEWRNGGMAKTWVGLLAVCIVFELWYIGWQAGLGEASHFNLSTPWHRTMYGLMAVGAISIVMAGAATGVMVMLDGEVAMAPAMRWTVGVAFVVSSGLTIVTALTMGARLTHHVGVEAAGAMRVPVLGWSLTVGDMRVPHFLATHLLQAGPVGAWVLGKVVSREMAVGLGIGWCVVWALGTLWVFHCVLGGRRLV